MFKFCKTHLAENNLKAVIRTATTLRVIENIAQLYPEYSKTEGYIGSARYEYHHVRDGSRVIIYATVGEEIVGVVQLLVKTNMAAKLMSEDAVLLQRLRVVPVFKRQGIGRALCLAAEDIAKQHGFGIIKLVVKPENDVAQKFYESLGYENFMTLTSKTSGEKLSAYQKLL